MYREIKKCRLCGSEEIKDILQLGSQYVVDFVPAQMDKMARAPLTLMRCTKCELVQLRHSVHPDLMYKKFWYRSGINEQMKKALLEVVDRAQEVAYVGKGDAVLDVGANDGHLLGWYPGEVRTVGVDPCAELVEEGLKHQRMDIGIKGYFSKELVEPHGPYKVITAIAMFYDLEDPVQFLKDCKSVLKRDGVIIVQMNYLPAMLKNNAVDNIEHEHLTYFSMTTMKLAADMAGLEIVGAETNDVNGGSFRVYLTHPDSGLYGTTATKQVQMFMKSMAMIHDEQKMKLDTIEPYAQFGQRVTEICKVLQNYLTSEAEKGEKIYVYGASTRGTVLMQLLNLPDGVILGAAERDVKKYNLQMMGTWTKIYPEEVLRPKATQFLLLPWHFLDQTWKREEDWLRRGGKLIVPLPEPRVLRWGGEKVSLLGAKLEEIGA